MTFIEWLLSTFGTAVVLAALIGAFWKVILNHVTASIKSKYDKEIETHKDTLKRESDKQIENLKAQLQAANNTEIEKLKAQLHIAASEKNIKLTNIFEKQAEAILTIYKKLYAVQESLKRFGYSRHSQEAERRQADDDLIVKNRDLRDYFNANKVLIHFDTSDKMDRFHQLVANLYIGNLMLDDKDSGPRSDAEIAERLEKRNELYQAEKEVPVVMKSLEKDFKRILGIQISDVVGSKAETKTA